MSHLSNRKKEKGKGKKEKGKRKNNLSEIYVKK